jgi:GNAT superfamily N-acetyltransferase
MTVDFQLLDPDRASDRALVREVADVVNAAYKVGEAGLWVEGTTRTAPAEVAEAIGSGGMLVAVDDRRIVGCAYLRQMDRNTADLGLVSTSPDRWGSGIGRGLVGLAEEVVRSRGGTTMQLELLVPTEGVHPEKDRLRRWYARLGYRVVRSAPFEQVAAHLKPRLARPCKFLVFRKALRTPGTA